MSTPASKAVKGLRNFVLFGKTLSLMRRSRQYITCVQLKTPVVVTTPGSVCRSMSHNDLKPVVALTGQ
jgi:hypothetical protein